MRKTVLRIALFTVGMMVVESTLVALADQNVFGVQGKQFMKSYTQWFVLMHILFEDGTQLVLYTITAAGSAEDPSFGVGLGVIQGVIFFMAKVLELFGSLTGSSSSSHPLTATKKKQLIALIEKGDMRALRKRLDSQDYQA